MKKNCFEKFGYPTDKGCDICGAKPGMVEPRFGYTTCERHCVLSPVRFSYIRDGLEEDTTVEIRHTDAERSEDDLGTVGKEVQKGWLD